MKIGMISRSTLYNSPGGDTVQVDMTAKYLRQLGVEVDIYTSTENINYKKYDLLHFFNIIRPDDILPHIQKTDVKFVLSPIFVDYFEFEKRNRTGIYKVLSNMLSRDQLEYGKAVYRWIKNGDRIESKFYLLRGHKAAVKYITSRAALFLPNSHSEFNRFVEVYKLHPNYEKVVYAIDPEIFSDSIVPNPEYSNHILCVGRIEGRKNQLNLIRALMNTDVQLTIVGKPSPNHINYYNECLALASEATNIHFVNHITHQELAAIYKAARVHILPSWFETAGLSSIEAGVMDCNIVITRKGDPEEYFADMAYYCEPESIESIRNTVMEAYNEPINTKLKSFILNNYIWKETASQTLNAYQSILQ